MGALNKGWLSSGHSGWGLLLLQDTVSSLVALSMGPLTETLCMGPLTVTLCMGPLTVTLSMCPLTVICLHVLSCNTACTTGLVSGYGLKDSGTSPNLTLALLS